MQLSNMTKAERQECGDYIAAKLAKRGFITQPAKYIAKLVAGWIEDYASEADESDPDDLPAEAYDPHDFEDQTVGMLDTLGRMAR